MSSFLACSCCLSDHKQAQCIPENMPSPRLCSGLRVILLILLIHCFISLKCVGSYHVVRSRHSAKWTQLGVPFGDVMKESAGSCKEHCNVTAGCRSAMFRGGRCFLYGQKFCPPCTSQYYYFYNNGSSPFSMAFARNVCLHYHMHLLAIESPTEAYNILDILKKTSECNLLLLSTIDI